MKYVRCKILFLVMVVLSCQSSQRKNPNTGDNFFLENKLLSDIEKMMDSNGHEILILRIKETDCSECIALELNNIKRTTKKVMENTLILAKFSNDRALSILKSKYSISLPILKYDDALNNSFEAEGKPYYFILGKDNRIRNLYISNLSDTSQIKQYLSIISANFE